ncbi:hypothetical protein GY45DRAFT_1168907 [Cubamyces sp. BRFM 1775]|nr:hypothetical protein GY45DRAFT_1168907 [Cubamyces sp. BRFM 1775]
MPPPSFLSVYSHACLHVGVVFFVSALARASCPTSSTPLLALATWNSESPDTSRIASSLISPLRPSLSRYTRSPLIRSLLRPCMRTCSTLPPSSGPGLCTPVLSIIRVHTPL